MKMEQTECSEMSAYKIQTQGNYPEESVQHSEHDKSLKSGIHIYYMHVQFLNENQFLKSNKKVRVLSFLDKKFLDTEFFRVRS